MQKELNCILIDVTTQIKLLLDIVSKGLVWKGYRMKEVKEITELIETLNFDEVQLHSFLDELRRNLITARTTRNISVVELSAKTGISESHIYKYEKAEGSLRIGTLVKILVALGLEWNDVVPILEDEKLSYGKRFEYIIRDLDAKTINRLLDNARAVAAASVDRYRKGENSIGNF